MERNDWLKFILNKSLTLIFADKRAKVADILKNISR